MTDLTLLFYLNPKTALSMLIWGEGLIVEGAKRGLERLNLGDHLYALRVCDDAEVVAERLQGDGWSYAAKRAKVLVGGGLARRPPVPAVSHVENLHVPSGSVVHHFVQPLKVPRGLDAAGRDVASGRDISAVVQRAGRLVGRDFVVTNAAQLGNVVVVDRREASSSPAEVQIRKSDPQRPIEVSIAAEHRHLPLDVNVVLWGDDDTVISDTLHRWTPGDPEHIVLQPRERCGRARVRAWRGGRLLWDEQCVFLLRIAASVSLGSPAVRLNDRLVKALESAVRGGSREAAELVPVTRDVDRSSPGVSMVVGDAESAWCRTFSQARSEMASYARATPAAGEYFPTGTVGRTKAILAFARLLSDARCFLFDPFFDREGAEDLLPRLPRETELTVVTCLSPDGERQGRSLSRYLEGAGHLVPTALKVSRLQSGNGRHQAFHDRVLIVFPNDAGPPHGYMLSNSFSGMAKKFPLIVAPLSPALVGRVLDDFEGALGDAADVVRLWPPDSPTAPVRYDAFGPWGRWLLARTLPRGQRPPRLRPWPSRAEGVGRLKDVFFRWDPDVVPRMLDLLFPLSFRARRLRRRGPQLPGARRGATPIAQRLTAAGEARARGLRFCASSVAARLPLRDAAEIARWLKRTFVKPSHTDQGDWRETAALHQALRAGPTSFHGTRIGVSLGAGAQGGGHHCGAWGRSFAYEVLLELDPSAAVAVGVELGDPSLVSALWEGWWCSGPERDRLLDAMLRSSNAFLCAMAIGRLYGEDGEVEGGDVAVSTRCPRLAAPYAAHCYALALFEWATSLPVRPAQEDLAARFLDALPNVLPESHGELAAQLLERRVALSRFAAATRTDGSGHRELGRAVIAAFDAACGTLSGGYSCVARVALVPAIAALRLRCGVSEGIEQAFPAITRAAARPLGNARLSPFRLRQGGMEMLRARALLHLLGVHAARNDGSAPPYPCDVEWAELRTGDPAFAKAVEDGLDAIDTTEP